MLLRKLCNHIKYMKQNYEDSKKFNRDKITYLKQCGENTLFIYDKENEFRILHEYKESAGNIDPHYFFQDIFVAKYVFKRGFKHVYDIGSRIDGYTSHLLGGGYTCHNDRYTAIASSN